MELTRVGDIEDPLEGTNVTLICLIHTDGENKMRNGFPSPPEWLYRMNDTGEMQSINKTNPPEGLTSYYSIRNTFNPKKSNQIRYPNEERI